MVHEVGAADAEVEHVDLLQDGVVEGIQEPGCVGHLVNDNTGLQGFQGMSPSATTELFILRVQNFSHMKC